MTGFAFMTLAELSAGLQSRAFSPGELLEDTLSRIEAAEPTLNTFACLDLEGARRDAAAATDRQMASGRLSPLDGIPTSVKDLIAQKDLPLRFGSQAMPETPAAADAPSVARLRAAGAVLLGKSTTSEFGCKAVGDSPLTGITRNPWDTDLTPGGSSCGAAAMVAAGLVPYALGTDGGGSVRIPAALCGLFGIKGQFGRVPIYPTSATPTLAHVGPLTRTVADGAIVMEVIAGFDRRDPFSIAGPVPAYGAIATTPGKALRIAYSPTLGYAAPTPAVLGEVESAVTAIAALGHHVEQVDTVMDDPAPIWTAEFYAGVGTRLFETIRSAPDLIDPAVLDVLRVAIEQNMRSYYASVFERYAFRDRMRMLFEKYDLLVTPTLPCQAFPVGRDVPPNTPDNAVVSWTSYTYPFNLTGQPAASVPAGFAGGLPVGLQIVGRSHDEATIFTLAAQYQSARSTLDRRPAPLVA